MNRIYFAQNPIFFRYTSDTGVLLTLDIEISDGATILYEIQKSVTFYDGEAAVNLSDIVTSVLPHVSPAMPTLQEVVLLTCYVSFLAIEYDEFGDSMTAGLFDFYAIQGGISNATFRKLEAESKNVFDNRLLATNPFLTNASVIRLTEATAAACPLYCYTTTNDSRLRITYKDKTASDATWEYPINSAEGIRAINLPALLSEFEQEVGMQLRAFKLEVVSSSNQARGAYVTIEQKPPTAQQRVVLWRNSWGAFEATQLNGQATRGVEAEKEEYLAYDAPSDSYTAKMQRGELTTSGTATTGYRTKEELLHLLDLYASHEHYLLNPDGTLTEVVLTSTSAELNLDSFEPQEHTVEWRLAVNEDKITVL